MKQLDHYGYFEESILDSENYFQTLFTEVCERKLISGGEMERIQMELLELMEKEVIRYTNDESSSIPVEKAQEILQSICFSIGFYLKSIFPMKQKLDALKDRKLLELYHNGLKGVQDCVNESRLLHMELQKTATPELTNFAYQDTVFKALSEFFHDYEPEFAAHITQASIDYPLSEVMENLCGVEYIYAYLQRLSLEQSFINKFALQDINLLLENYDEQAKHMLINIYEIVLTNAFACVLLDQKLERLLFNTQELDWLKDYLGSLADIDLEKRGEQTLDFISKQLNLSVELTSYNKKAYIRMLPRLKHNLQTGTLHNFFVVATSSKEGIEVFEDGSPMEDEQLRNFIEVLRGISTTAEKIFLMKSTVRSQADLIELLEACFEEDEYEEVLTSFSELEKDMLRRSLLYLGGYFVVEDYEPQKKWEQLLFLQK
ncbi:MAG: hypothetical protein K0R00_3712 [Herbinix sp.]|jgi:hypothetical protein|nr:hypothetical protein [Herbinix sp.]